MADDRTDAARPGDGINLTERRVRTQAERDADGHTWRRIAPECSTGHPQLHADCDGCTCSCHPPIEQARARIAGVLAEDLPALGAALAELTAAPPRRRWWHRLTRRNP